MKAPMPAPTAAAAAAAIAASSRARFPGPGVDASTIGAAERMLGVKFSPSFVWFLRTYGSGYVGGYELNGLCPLAYTGDFDGDMLEIFGDIVACHLRNKSDSTWNPAHVELLNVEGDDIFLFDMTELDSDGEMAIKRKGPLGEIARFARNFWEFLIMIVRGPERGT